MQILPLNKESEETMTKEFVLDILKVCNDHGYLPDTLIRDFSVRLEYVELRNAGSTGKEARIELSKKYFTSQKNIEFILYGKKKNDN